MKKIEIESKAKELMGCIKELTAENKNIAEKFVNDSLGEEYKLFYFCSDGFDVKRMKDGEAMFASGFEVRMRDDWHYNEDGKFVCTTKVCASVGTCGEFEIGKNDDQEQRYLALGRFLTKSRECLFNVALLNFHDEVKKIQKELDKVEEQWENAND